MDSPQQARRAVIKKIAYPLLAVLLAAFLWWQHARPDPMWPGRDKDFWYETLYLASFWDGNPRAHQVAQEPLLRGANYFVHGHQLFLGYRMIYSSCRPPERRG